MLLATSQRSVPCQEQSLFVLCQHFLPCQATAMPSRTVSSNKPIVPCQEYKAFPFQAVPFQYRPTRNTLSFVLPIRYAHIHVLDTLSVSCYNRANVSCA